MTSLEDLHKQILFQMKAEEVHKCDGYTQFQGDE